ncbi:MAG: glycosyltransferase family 4 protein [Candidatus Micrarchaeota archaeon]
MKVAMLGSFYPGPKEGGVEQHVYHLSASLEKLGVEVERWSWKAEGRGIRKLGLLGIRGALGKSDADLAHFHSTATAFSYFTGIGKYSGKSVSTMHAFFHPEMEASPRLKAISHLLSYPYKQALKRIRNNIAVSTYAKKEAEGYGIPVGAVIGSGIPLGEIKKTKPNPEHESEVVLVARLNNQKGVFDFIEAFSNSETNAAVFGYGDKGAEERTKRLCERGGIKCTIRAKRGETLSAIASSKVLAFPSKNETFGIVGLEAMALGKPVVVYDEAGGPLDYIKDKYNGLVVRSNPNGLKGGVASILGDRSFLKKLSKNAEGTAKEHDWPIAARKVKSFYESALG